jgi:enoyl-CoA hydratase/carnithine racemase
MNYEFLKVETKNNIAILTLNRPEVMNSLNFPLLKELNHFITEANFQKDVRVIIITGEGQKAFCAGADLKERRELSPEEVKRYIFTIRTTFTAVEYLPKPVIAAVNGIALGGGTELALASDIRLASSTAKMGLTETSLAIIPGAGGTQRLVRAVGKGKAKELIFLAKRITAEEAYEIGMVNKVVEPDKLMEEAMEMAEQICKNGPLAVEQAKMAINYGSETDIYTGLAFETQCYNNLIPTKDRIEGLQAFKEKRKPQYKGE